MSANSQRRAAGNRALKPYNPKTEGKETALIDLLANVMHATSLDKIDWDRVVKTAREHYDAEANDVEQFT